MHAAEPIITPEHIRDLWDAGLNRGQRPDQPALCLTAEGRVVVSDRAAVQASGTVVITAAELRNFTRGRFTAQDAREVAWALTEELRLGLPA
ncbi:hypothetical protein [Jiangella asiatica]|uniref:Uncharacterized protein n=1 Tax=Jiangella asiatica TaxID=2530372 RepID=A0A4R5CLX1_9ACTN|nr:hypothetical protein [Jiangella asiatica]TDE00277.1 hypothetical protein E1269_26055 [Jiangella asiatica]